MATSFIKFNNKNTEKVSVNTFYGDAAKSKAVIPNTISTIYLLILQELILDGNIFRYLKYVQNKSDLSGKFGNIFCSTICLAVRSRRHIAALADKYEWSNNVTMPMFLW